MCVYRLDMYPGASLLRSLYMKKPLLYSSCFCRLIILISFNFWSVVRVVSGRERERQRDRERSGAVRRERDRDRD